MPKIINWDKTQPMIIGWKEGYVELRVQNDSVKDGVAVLIDVGVNNVHQQTHKIGDIEAVRVVGKTKLALHLESLRLKWVLDNMVESIRPTLVKLVMRKA